MPTYSTLAKLQLLSAFQDSTESLTVFADYHRLRPRTLATWIHQFLTAGLAGIRRPSRNQSYSTELKFQAVHDYRQGMSPKELLVKYQIRNVSQLYQWKVQYNNGELSETNSLRRTKRKMGRKVSYEEKVAITKWVLAKSLMLVIPEFTLGSRRVTLAKIGRPFMTTEGRPATNQRRAQKLKLISCDAKSRN